MTTMTRRTTVSGLASLIGLGLAGAISLGSVDARKKHKKKKKHKKGGKNGGGTPPGGNPNPGGGDPSPVLVTRTERFVHAGAVGISTEGPSKEYPSEIVVDPAAFPDGKITKVTVRFPGFLHDFPDDVNILLVGPQGQNVQLMSDVGGDQVGTERFDITFDDDAPTGIPVEGPLSNGTFKPSNEANTDEYPAPAPTPDFNATLAVFNGTNPAGTWQLFIVDDVAGDGGVLLEGWSLTISAEILV